MYRAEILIGLSTSRKQWSHGDIVDLTRKIAAAIEQKHNIIITANVTPGQCVYAGVHATVEEAANVILTVNPHKPTGTFEHLLQSATLYKEAMRIATGNWVVPGIVFASCQVLDITQDVHADAEELAKVATAAQ
jgi:hypothetical protein